MHKRSICLVGFDASFVLRWTSPPILSVCPLYFRTEIPITLTNTQKNHGKTDQTIYLSFINACKRWANCSSSCKRRRCRYFFSLASSICARSSAQSARWCYESKPNHGDDYSRDWVSFAIRKGRAYIDKLSLSALINESELIFSPVPRPLVDSHGGQRFHSYRIFN